MDTKKDLTREEKSILRDVNKEIKDKKGVSCNSNSQYNITDNFMLYFILFFHMCVRTALEKYAFVAKPFENI
jgi:hypothetical protein